MTCAGNSFIKMLSTAPHAATSAIPPKALKKMVFFGLLYSGKQNRHDHKGACTVKML